MKILKKMCLIGGLCIFAIGVLAGCGGEEPATAQEDVSEVETAPEEEAETGEQEPAETAHEEEEVSEIAEDGEEDAEAGSETESAEKLYDLFGAYDEIREADGLPTEVPIGPIEEIHKLIRAYNANEDIKEVSLERQDYENASVSYMEELQEGEPIEYTCLVGEKESGAPIVMYINTEKGIYYVGTASGKSADGVGTVYYNVKRDDATGLMEYYAYYGMWLEGKSVDAGSVIHVYDEIVSGTGEDEGKLVSRLSAYLIDQNGSAYQFYDVYNNEGGREMETSEGEFEEYKATIPEWELGEY